MRAHAEVGIVGAGPAGARAAELLAAQGADVVLLDPKAPWEKPCGGGLPSTLLDEVPELEEIRPVARPLNRVRVELGADVGFELDLERPIWMVSRETLAHWQLARALAAGASHESARVRAVARAPRGWRLDTERGSLTVGTLVGADGAASTVRRATASGLRVELLAAREVYPHEEGPVPDTIVLRFYPGLVGYLWDFPRLGHRSVGIEVAAGSGDRADLDARIEEYLGPRSACAGLPHVGAVIGAVELRPGCFSRMAGSDFALLGDAAGLADPFTGEGIRNALRSAALLARAHGSGRAEWTTVYARLVRRAFAKELIIARLLRRSLSERRAGVSLVEQAVRSDRAYALAAAILDSLCAHDYGLRAFVRRWRRHRASVRRAHDETTQDSPGGSMPVYDYRCTSCGHEFIVIESLEEHGTSKPKCPDCGSAKVERVIKGVHVQTGKKS